RRSAIVNAHATEMGRVRLVRGILVQARSRNPKPRRVRTLFRPTQPNNSGNDAARSNCVSCPCRRAQEASIREVDKSLSKGKLAKQTFGKATELGLGFACSIARDDDQGDAEEYGNKAEKSQ